MARQLRLWADAGAPAPPRLDEWPPNAFDCGPIEVDERLHWSRALATSRAERAALEAVRRTLRGTPEESPDTPAAQRVAQMLRSEYEQRNVPLSPGLALRLAELLLMEREPLGRWRVGMSVLGQLPGVVRELLDTVREVRSAFTEDVTDDETPEADTGPDAPWPEGALFDVRPDSSSWVEVTIDATTEAALREAATRPDGRTAESTPLRTWLAEAETARREAGLTTDTPVPRGSIVVGCGHDALGHFPPGSGGHQAFSVPLAAAAAFKELPVAEGELRWTPHRSGRSLALHPPHDTWLPPSSMR